MKLSLAYLNVLGGDSGGSFNFRLSYAGRLVIPQGPQQRLEIVERRHDYFLDLQIN